MSDEDNTYRKLLISGLEHDRKVLAKQSDDLLDEYNKAILNGDDLEITSTFLKLEVIQQKISQNKKEINITLYNNLRSTHE